MFNHLQTTVGNIRIVADECHVSATVETVKVTPRGHFPGPDINFDICLPLAKLDKAYDCAVATGRRLFERFNEKQQALAAEEAA